MRASAARPAARLERLRAGGTHPFFTTRFLNSAAFGAGAGGSGAAVSALAAAGPGSVVTSSLARDASTASAIRAASETERATTDDLAPWAPFLTF